MNQFRKSEVSQAIENLHVYSINPVTRELFLHGVYDAAENGESQEAGIDYRMATGFIKNLHFLNQQSDSNILIHQHTVGGDWNDGIAIFNALQFSKSTTTMVAYAHSRSMSSITIQAIDKRILMPDSDFMVHYGWLMVADNCIGAITNAKKAEQDNIRMLKIYASRCKYGKFFKDRKTTGEKTICQYIDKIIKEKVDWFMTPEEAVFYGFADGIFGQKGFEDFDIIRKPKRQRSMI
jgi:ATP-dependent protease ClpP protease subunit